MVVKAGGDDKDVKSQCTEGSVFKKEGP